MMAARWGRRLLATLVIAATVHLLIVWALPRVIMHKVLNTTPQDLGAKPGATASVYFPPMTDASQRRILMPSPDLLYATCVFDVSVRPLRVRADPRLPGYWSVALYAANSDNFFVVNDRQLAGKPLDLVLVGARGAASKTLPAGARVVSVPSDKGLVLMRVLVADYAAEQSVLEAARRTLRCEALPPG
jgi:uncharacterized membrane protein